MDKVKRAYALSILVVIIIAALLLLIIFFTSYNKIYLTNIGFIKANYFLASSYCSSPSSLKSIGLEKMCVQTYMHDTSRYNLSIIPVIIYAFFKFNSSTSANNFINNVTQYFNTTPWPENVHVNISTYSNYIYTTEYAPYINDGKPMWAYTLYYSNGSKVLSLSVVNSTQNQLTTLNNVIAIMNYLRGNISKIN
ncbi:MAG: hypothetical protein RXR32_03460 [Candidatus Micrarchaeota archaeon]